MLQVINLVLRSISLSLLSLFFFISAQADETISITTYYPSPYGTYDSLEANKMTVGDITGDGKLTTDDLPPANGQLYAARSVIYNPQAVLPALDVREGELVYSGGALYVYNNEGEWSKLGGGCYVSYSGPECKEGFNNEGSIGYWSICRPIAADSGFFSPPGGGCPDLVEWSTEEVAEAFVCCQ